ncbi:MAG: hypothetical protein LBC80_02845, partial [Treponema sp.]|nr:hypothetical protein [Treponema sp.]
MKLLKPAVFCKMFIFFLAFFLLGACNDPIFFLISEEIPLIPPLIKGSPTNFVLFEDKNEDDELEKYIFAASGRNIFRYKDGFWEENYLKLDYRIGQLAATKDYLYVLCLRDTGSAVTIKLLRYDRAEWKEITNTCNDYTVIQTIFSPNLDDNKLYIGAHKSSRTDGVLEYAILFVDGGEDEIKPTGITGIRALLNGVASNGSDTFFSTRNGIYLAGGSTTPIPTFPATDDNDNPTTITNFSRIIKLPDNNVVALTQSGNVHQFSAANIVRTPVASFPENRGDATGSFAIWPEK